MVLGATILLDFLVIVLFNATEALAASVMSDGSASALGKALGVTLAQLLLSAAAGVAFGYMLPIIVFWRGARCVPRKHRRHGWQQAAKKALLLISASLVFIASHACHP